MARKKDYNEYSTPRLRQILAWIIRCKTSGNTPTVSQLGRTFYQSDKLGYAPEPWNVPGVHAMKMANRLQRLGLITLYKHEPGFPTFINLTEHGIMVYAAHVFNQEDSWVSPT